MGFWYSLFGNATKEVIKGSLKQDTPALRNGILELEGKLNIVKSNLVNKADIEVLWNVFAQAEQAWNKLHYIVDRERNQISSSTLKKLYQLEDEYKSYRSKIGYFVYDE